MEQDLIIEEYFAFLTNKAYPCIGAKTAITKQQLKCIVVDHMACPKDDRDILQFLYDFINNYRNSIKLFHSATVIFKQPTMPNEEMFDGLLWQKLQVLADLDSENYSYDNRVSKDPSSPFFSFSLKEEALFIEKLHPASSKSSRQFKYPAVIFNPHAQFEKLRETNHYENMKNIIRKRDATYSGSLNPMLKDFGDASEVYQYSGRKHDTNWQCPFKPNHDETGKHNPAT